MAGANEGRMLVVVLLATLTATIAFLLSLHLGGWLASSRPVAGGG